MNSIQNDKAHAISQWNLRDLTVIYECANKAVYKGKSVIYGDVILKVNHQTNEFIDEFRMLRFLKGQGSCNAYEYDEARGLLLEERILPGTVLREVQNREKRIDIFGNVFQRIHHKAPEEFHSTYLDWFEHAHDNIRKIAKEKQQESVKEFVKETDIAYDLAKELFAKYPDRVLLHGDLHHDNILACYEREYVMIDPKAIVGPAIFDVPRFLLNEINMVKENKIVHILDVIKKISNDLSFPEKDIRKLLFMEIILASVWNIEDGEEVEKDLLQIAREIKGVEF